MENESGLHCGNGATERRSDGGHRIDSSPCQRHPSAGDKPWIGAACILPRRKQAAKPGRDGARGAKMGRCALHKHVHVLLRLQHPRRTLRSQHGAEGQRIKLRVDSGAADIGGRGNVEQIQQFRIVSARQERDQSERAQAGSSGRLEVMEYAERGRRGSRTASAWVTCTHCGNSGRPTKMMCCRPRMRGRRW